VFIDGQNLYHRCIDHFGWGWIHPMKLAKELVKEDKKTYGNHSHVLGCVRYYTGIHQVKQNPVQHGKMTRRLAAYDVDGVAVTSIPLRYDSKTGKAREKGIDVRLAIDMVRFGRKGLFDVAIVVSEDSDLDEAVQDLYDLRDHERWLAVENALPASNQPGIRKPHWLASAKRRRPITQQMFSVIQDRKTY
jgi:uncharacterized LabA/DUF88 family protein